VESVEIDAVERALEIYNATSLGRTVANNVVQTMGTLEHLGFWTVEEAFARVLSAFTKDGEPLTVPLKPSGDDPAGCGFHAGFGERIAMWAHARNKLAEKALIGWLKLTGRPEEFLPSRLVYGFHAVFAVGEDDYLPCLPSEATFGGSRVTQSEVDGLFEIPELGGQVSLHEMGSWVFYEIRREEGMIPWE